MKTPSDKLFNLIKSLDKHEKRYFKMHSTGKKGYNSYVKLFDKIDKQTVYDESGLKHKLKDEAFLKNFKVMKSYLFEALLNSLADYHNEVSIDSRLRQLLHKAEILEKKRLVELTLQLLSKAEKLAIEHEKYEYVLLALSLKIGTLRKAGLSEKVNDYLKTDALKEHDYMAYIKNASDFRALTVRAELITENSQEKMDKKNERILKSIINSPLLSSPKKALTFSSLRYYYYIHFVCTDRIGKWNDAAYLKQKEWVNYLEKEPLKLQNRAENYIAALSRFMVAQFRTERVEETSATFNKGKAFYLSLPPKMKNKNLLAFIASLTSNYVSSELILLRPEKALAAWESIKRTITHSTLNANSNIVIFGNLFYANFLCGNFRESLRYANKILNFKSGNRNDVQKETRLMLLMVHFELGHSEHLQGLAGSSLRWILKNDSLHVVEETLLNFFGNRIHKANSSDSRIAAFRQLKEDITSLLKRSGKPAFLEHFDLIAWIDSRIQDRPLIDILRKK
ncbi:MAG: hypothetical protein HYU69_12985 [Bacteroidetes bacterium]|nr:hypothetical protein [Bacteroidota bacterium]